MQHTQFLTFFITWSCIVTILCRCRYSSMLRSSMLSTATLRHSFCISKWRTKTTYVKLCQAAFARIQHEIFNVNVLDVKPNSKTQCIITVQLSSASRFNFCRVNNVMDSLALSLPLNVTQSTNYSMPESHISVIQDSHVTWHKTVGKNTASSTSIGRQPKGAG